MQRKRIGIITHNYPANHLERKDAGIFIHDFAEALKGKGNKVYILCPDFGAKKENYKKIPVAWFKWGGNSKLGNIPLFSLAGIVQIIKLLYFGTRKTEDFLRRNSIDLCISMWAFPAGFWSIFSKKEEKVKTAVITLGSDIFIYAKFPVVKSIISFILKKMNYRFGNSYKICEEVKKISGKNCTFIPMMNSFNRYKGEKVSLNKQYFHFLFVGRLEIVKGPDILVEAASLLSRLNNKFKVHILGEGSMMKSLKNKVISEQLQSNVLFYGWADEKQVGKYMTSVDALVIPSRSESLPFVLLEAAHSGLPVITTNVGDMEKVVNKYKIGYSVQRENPELLARKMNLAIEKKKELKKTTSSGLQKISSYYTLLNTVRLFLNEVK